MNNMPELKIGVVAVSRDCFPESLSVNRRRALIDAYEDKYGKGTVYECPVCIVESEIHMVQALEDIKKAGCNALCVYLGNFGPEISETLLAKHFDGPKMFVAAAEETGDDLCQGRGDAYCGMLNASYKGWWPVFDFDLYSGRYDYESFNEGFFLPTRQKETFYAQYKAWRSSAEVTVRFPFTLSARQYNRTLQPYVRYRFVGLHHEKLNKLYTCKIAEANTIWITQVDPNFYQVNEPSRFYQLLEYGLYFTNQTRMTTQEINPRWGQTFSAGYTHSPLEHIDLGYQWWGDGHLYFPGFTTNHSLSLYGGFQHMSHKERNYSNKILYPRGITLPGYEIASLRTGYHMPITFPDLPLSSLLYLKTINAAVFYDWGSSRNKFGKATYSSYGIELTTDTHFFRLTYPIRLGIRTGYETQHKKMFADLIFSIGLSI